MHRGLGVATSNNLLNKAVLVLVCLKILADMFWQFPVLDMLLLGFALVILGLHLPQSRVSYGLPDAASVLLLTLLTFSFSKSVDGAVVFFKMASAITLYFLGRESSESFNEAVKGVLIASIFVLILNAATFVSGAGFQTWGDANTFSGPYYFKTDLASAMSLVLITGLYYINQPIIKIIYLIVCSLLIVASNARAYYIILLLTGGLYITYRLNIRITVKLAIYGLVGILGALYLLNWIFSTGIFQDMGYVGIQFDSLSDLFDAANTQGRNAIWDDLFSRISSGGLGAQLLGFDLTGDIVVVNGSEYGAHSLYVGLLYNTGVIGLACFMYLLLYAFNSIRNFSQIDSTKAYYVITLLVQVLISGVSVHVLQFTGNVWIPMLFFGMAITIGREYKETTRPHLAHRPSRKAGV